MIEPWVFAFLLGIVSKLPWEVSLFLGVLISPCVAVWWLCRRWLTAVVARAAHDPRPASFAAETTAALQREGFPCSVETGAGGLAVFATRPILAGETILVERPLTLTVSPKVRMRVCAVCLADSQAQGHEAWARRCEVCMVPYYCSDECAAAGRALHAAVECPALVAALQATDIHLGSFETIARAVRILADGVGGRKVHVGATGTHNAAEALSQRLVRVKPPTTAESRACMRSALAALRVVPTSAHVPAARLVEGLAAQTCNSVDVPGPSRGMVLGTACFGGACQLLNHACRPNVVLDAAQPVAGPMADGSAPAFAVRALEDIASGAELTLAYARESPSLLLREYGFACACDRCKRRGGAVADREFREWEERLRCPPPGCGCGFGVPVSPSTSGVDPSSGGCSSAAATLPPRPSKRLRCAGCAHQWLPSQSASDTV